MSQVRKALAYSFLGANTVTLIQFGSTLVIARLLTPEEIGIYSVAAVFIGIAALLRDFGVTNYLVQANELSTQMLRSALGLITLTSTILSLAILLCSGSIAEFYRTPDLQPVLNVLALNTLLVPLGAITLTVARRQMRFRALSAINVASALVTMIVSITLATLDYGPISLAWGGVAGTLTSAALSLRLRNDEIPWMPSLRKLSDIASFGAASGGASIIGYINVTAGDILLGRLLGMEHVGLFNRALSLTQFVSRALSSAMNPVLLPWLSQIKRDNQHPRHAYRKVVELTTGVTWPIFASVAVLNEELVLVLFGDQWGQSATLVPYICISAGIGSVYAVCSPLYNAIGKPSADFYAQSANLPIKVGAIIFLAPQGIEAVASSWPWIASLGAAMHSLMLKRYTTIGLSDTLSALAKSTALMITAMVASATVSRLAVGILEPGWTLVAGGTTAAASTLIVASIIKHPVMNEVIQIVANRAGRRL